MSSRNYFFISENSNNETSQFHWFTTIIIFPQTRERKLMSNFCFGMDFKKPTAIDLAETSGSKDLI